MSAATDFSGSSYSMTVADGQSVRLIRTSMPDLGSTIASPRKGGEIGRRLPAEAKALGSVKDGWFSTGVSRVRVYMNTS